MAGRRCWREASLVLARRWAQEQSTRGKRLAVLSTSGRKNGRLCLAGNGGDGDGDGALLLVVGGSGREIVGGRDRGGERETGVAGFSWRMQ